MKFLRIVSTLVVVLLLGGGLWFLVSNPHAIPPFLNGALMIAMPLALGIWIARRWRQEWRLFGIGAMTFVAAQVLHIPFNVFLLNPLLERLGLTPEPGSWGLVWMAVALGLSSGLFEEVARWITLRRFLPEARSWAEGLMVGAGHGGIEAMILGALVLYAFLQMIVLYGASPEALVVLVGGDNLEQVRAAMAAYWDIPWYDQLLGALERVSALVFHLSAGLLVMQAVVSGRSRWLWAAVGWHALLNGLTVFVSQTYSIYIAEALLLGLAAVSVGIILWLKRVLPLLPAQPELIDAPALQPLAPARPKREQIEDSRYD